MWLTTGQPKIIEIFQRALAHNSLSHAYLLMCPARVEQDDTGPGFSQSVELPGRKGTEALRRVRCMYKNN